MTADPYAGIRKAIAALRGNADHRDKWRACLCDGLHHPKCTEGQAIRGLREAADAAEADLRRIESPAPSYKGCLLGCGTQHATVNGSAAVAFKVHVDGCPNAASPGALRLPPATGPDFY